MNAAAHDDLSTQWTIELHGEHETHELAQFIASFVGANDLITLTGDLGAGKTAFARALIRILCNDSAPEVPSPTFTLMQLYNGTQFPIVHADLYRISGANELVELGWDEAGEGALVLVEWPERAGPALQANRLDIALRADPQKGLDWRSATLTGHGALAARLSNALAIAALLEKSGWADAKREFMLGDASSRAYERLTKADGSRAILMISPPRPDGPPVRAGKSYSAIARLAENITPFVALGHGLLAQGLTAPRIHAADLKTGLAVLEDLGLEFCIDANGPVPERYGEAVAALAHLHTRSLPAVLPVPGAADYAIPPYDLDAMLIEIELLSEWYAPHMRIVLSSAAKAAFVNAWRSVLQDIVDGPQTWVLRDYHSPNLLWLDQRKGIERVGVIDFQDCVMGSPAYDVASLLQDARVTVPAELELKLLGHYAGLRRASNPDFDMAAFARAYAIMGAQRATKVLGIFARLDRRDGKPQYLAHMPRVRSYLVRNLSHPALSGIKGWFSTHLPALFR